MYKRILIATDGSRQSWRALPLVALLAGGEARARVFHVPESQLVPAVYGEAKAEALGLETPREANELVRKFVNELHERGLPADGRVATKVASIPELILEDLREFSADLVVVGSRGLSPFRGLLLGSVSHVVLQLAPCSVLVVRGAVPRRRVERILLAYDGSEQSRLALKTSYLLAKRLHARVVVAHARPGDGPLAERMVAEALHEFATQGVQADGLVLNDLGHPGLHLARAAVANRSQIIVMGARGHSELAGLLLGSVTFKLVHLGPCPVLVVR